MQRYPIANMSEYKRLAAQARRSGYVHTNCYLMPAAVQEKTAAGRLFRLELEGALLILEADEGGFYRVYYFLSPDFDGPEIALDRDAVIEFPFKPPLEEDKRRRAEPALIARLGFSLGRESAFLTANADSVFMGPVRLPTGYAVAPARPEQADKIMALYRASFDPLYAFLPTDSELAGDIADGCVFAAARDGEIVGALSGHQEKNYAVCDLVAVRPKCRGTGLGKALLVEHHNRYRNRVQKYHAWTDKRNRASMSMYSSLGYAGGEREREREREREPAANELQTNISG